MYINYIYSAYVFCLNDISISDCQIAGLLLDDGFGGLAANQKHWLGGKIERKNLILSTNFFCIDKTEFCNQPQEWRLI